MPANTRVWVWIFWVAIYVTGFAEIEHAHFIDAYLPNAMPYLNENVGGLYKSLCCSNDLDMKPLTTL